MRTIFRITWRLCEGLSTWESTEAGARERLAAPPGAQRWYDVIYDVRVLAGTFQLWHDEVPLFGTEHMRVVRENLRASYPVLGHPAPPPLTPEEAADLVEGGVGVSLIDLARQLALIVESGFGPGAPDGAATRFTDSNSTERIRFMMRNGRVVVTSLRPATATLAVPRPDFFGGVERFLREFAESVAVCAPSLMDLEALEPVRPYLPGRQIASEAD